MKINTKTIHGGQHPEETSGAIMPPIFQTSTYVQEAPGKHKGHEYARVTNPTRTNLENLIASVEGGNECACFASGCSAMDAMIKMLNPGDHVIASNDLYGGTYRLFTTVFERFGISFSFVDMSDIDTIANAVTSNTKMMWIETPTNPLLTIVDIKACVELAKAHDILTVVDNTFATPILQRPLELGADAVIHSTSKYIGGHSDLIGGAIVSSHEEIMENARFQVKTTGGVPGPMDCYLAIRGMKTMAIRVERACENAIKVAEFLKSHPKVGEVRFPGLKDHPGHDIASRQMDGFGAMVSFALKSDSIEKAHTYMSKTHLFTLAESLGAVESLISHPASMTHGSIPVEKRREFGLKDSLIRLSVGIEDIDDLLADLDQAFQYV